MKISRNQIVGAALALGILGFIDSMLPAAPRVPFRPATADNIMVPHAADPVVIARVNLANWAVDAVRQAARDPASVRFDHVLVSPDAKTVCVDYGARNGFGAMDRGQIVWRNGKPSELVSMWNARCLGDMMNYSKVAA